VTQRSCHVKLKLETKDLLIAVNVTATSDEGGGVFDFSKISKSNYISFLIEIWNLVYYEGLIRLHL
jgi:hypothetical protein